MGFIECNLEDSLTMGQLLNPAIANLVLTTPERAHCISRRLNPGSYPCKQLIYSIRLKQPPPSVTVPAATVPPWLAPLPTPTTTSPTILPTKEPTGVAPPTYVPSATLPAATQPLPAATQPLPTPTNIPIIFLIALPIAGFGIWYFILRKKKKRR